MAFKSQVTITRPANVTPYNAGDVVGGAFKFVGMPDPDTSGSGSYSLLLTSVGLAIYVAAIPSGMTSFRIPLYDGKPASAIADNAAWDLPSGDRAAYLGYIDVGSPADAGSTLYVQADQLNKQILVTKSLWGYLITNGGFTPAGNSEIYVPSLFALSI